MRSSTRISSVNNGTVYANFLLETEHSTHWSARRYPRSARLESDRKRHGVRGIRYYKALHQESSTATSRRSLSDIKTQDACWITDANCRVLSGDSLPSQITFCNGNTFSTWTTDFPPPLHNCLDQQGFASLDETIDGQYACGYSYNPYDGNAEILGTWKTQKCGSNYIHICTCDEECYNRYRYTRSINVNSIEPPP